MVWNIRNQNNSNTKQNEWRERVKSFFYIIFRTQTKPILLANGYFKTETRTFIVLTIEKPSYLIDENF